jgi:hypothetical protein
VIFLRPGKRQWFPHTGRSNIHLIENKWIFNFIVLSLHTMARMMLVRLTDLFEGSASGGGDGYPLISGF